MVSEVRWELVEPYVEKTELLESVCDDPLKINDYVKFALDRVKNMNSYMDCHWVAQVRYVEQCDHVLRLERLQEDFQNLMKEYGLDIELGDQHHMNDQNELEDEQCRNISIENLTDEVETLLGESYHDDLLLWRNIMKSNISFDL
mmetsp:Transcript_15961/g.22390  ORF Transcript_15961/g.22390 Transcript_15961/m.22390 type:complete len:145 (+) Transcript_15961:724-1158(+)